MKNLIKKWLWVFMICYNNLLKILFIISLVLSISPITASSIETQNISNNNYIDALTQANHMEVMPLDNTTNNEKINVNIKNGIHNLGRSRDVIGDVIVDIFSKLIMCAMIITIILLMLM